MILFRKLISNLLVLVIELPPSDHPLGVGLLVVVFIHFVSYLDPVCQRNLLHFYALVFTQTDLLPLHSFENGMLTHMTQPLLRVFLESLLQKG
jgi:hypothetical protein